MPPLHGSIGAHAPGRPNLILGIHVMVVGGSRDFPALLWLYSYGQDQLLRRRDYA